MHVTCFGLYLDHPQACQHKNIYSNIKQNSKGPMFTFTACVVLKYYPKYIIYKVYPICESGNVHIKDFIY
jgi:hypothetical protein